MFRPIHFVQSVPSKQWVIEYDDVYVPMGMSYVMIEVSKGVYENAIADIKHHQGKTTIDFLGDVRGSVRFMLVMHEEMEIVYDGEKIHDESYCH